MGPPPELIDGARVLLYTRLDERQRRTGACRHFVRGVLRDDFASLAICQYEDDQGFYLFYCDEAWATINDTYWETLERAQQQAEFEYEGVRHTWLVATSAGQP